MIIAYDWFYCALRQCLQTKPEVVSGNMCTHVSFLLVSLWFTVLLLEWNLNSEVILICKKNSKAVLKCSLNGGKKWFGYPHSITWNCTLSLDIGCKMCLRSLAFVLWHLYDLWFACVVAVKSSCIVLFHYSMWWCLILVSITEDCFSMNLSQLPLVKKTLFFFLSWHWFFEM